MYVAALNQNNRVWKAGACRRKGTAEECRYRLGSNGAAAAAMPGIRALHRQCAPIQVKIASVALKITLIAGRTQYWLQTSGAWVLFSERTAGAVHPMALYHAWEARWP